MNWLNKARLVWLAWMIKRRRWAKIRSTRDVAVLQAMGSPDAPHFIAEHGLGERHEAGEASKAALIAMGPVAVEAVASLLDSPPDDFSLQVIRGYVLRRCEDAIDVLAAINDDRTIAPLCRVLSWNDYRFNELRTRAALALGTKRASQAVEPLLACLDHAELPVVTCAIKALGCIGVPSAIEPICLATRLHYKRTVEIDELPGDRLLLGYSDEVIELFTSAVDALRTLGATEAQIESLDREA